MCFMCCLWFVVVVVGVCVCVSLFWCCSYVWLCVLLSGIFCNYVFLDQIQHIDSDTICIATDAAYINTPASWMSRRPESMDNIPAKDPVKKL